MTKKECALLFAAMAAAYHNFNIENQQKKDLWYKMLSDLPYKVAEAAVYKLLMVKEFPPSIAEIRRAAVEVACPVPSAGEAWAEVENAIRNYGHYRADEGKEALSPLTQQAVRALGGLSGIGRSENIGVERGHFLKIYSTLAQRERDTRQLPNGLRQAIDRLKSPKAQEQLLSIGQLNKLATEHRTGGHND